MAKNGDAELSSLAVGAHAIVGDVNNGTLSVGLANVIGKENSGAIGYTNYVQEEYALAVGNKATIDADSGILFAVGTGRADFQSTENNGFYVKYNGHECSAYVQKEDSSGNVIIKELGGDIEWYNF